MSLRDEPTSEPSPFVRALLEAAQAEAVPAASRARVAQRLGISVPEGSSDAPRAEAPPARAGRASWGKVTLLAVIGGLCVAGFVSTRAVIDGAGAPTRAVETETALAARAPLGPAVDSLAPLPMAPLPSSSRSSASVAAEPRSAEPALAARRATEAPVRRAERRSGPSPAVRSAPVPVVAPSAAAGSARNLLAEVRALDAIRAALRERRAAAALQQLGAYAHTFPDGELELEAAVLRVKALFAAQRSSEARALAGEIVARAGSERYRRELRELSAQSE